MSTPAPPTAATWDGETWELLLPDPEATFRAGRLLGESAVAPLVVALNGGLGAGKTSLAQGVGVAAGLPWALTSPTFSLINELDGHPPILHADLYRLEPGELVHLGFEEQLEGWGGISLVEWAERAPDVLPLDHLEVHLELTADGGRRLRARSRGSWSDRSLHRWVQAWASAAGGA